MVCDALATYDNTPVFATGVLRDRVSETRFSPAWQ